MLETLAQHRHTSRESLNIYKHEVNKDAKWVLASAEGNAKIAVGPVIGLDQF